MSEYARIRQEYYDALIGVMLAELKTSRTRLAMSVIRRLLDERISPHPREPAIASYYLYWVHKFPRGTAEYALYLSILKARAKKGIDGQDLADFSEGIPVIQEALKKEDLRFLLLEDKRWDSSSPGTS